MTVSLATALPTALTELVDSQTGVMTRAQALAHGLTRTQVTELPDAGWQRLGRGVYSHQGDDWLQRAWAGVLLGGPTAAIGGRAAASLLGFHDRAVGVVDVWLPPGVRKSRADPDDNPALGWRFRRGERHIQNGSSLQHLTAAETILDLARGAGSEDLSGWVSRAINQGLITTETLRTAMTQRQRMPGRALLSRVLAAADLGVESPLELLYFRDVERAHGLPAGVRQLSVSQGTRSDVLYEKWKLLVELDGELGHRGEGEVRDATRDGEHLAIGLATLRFGYVHAKHEPCSTARLVARVLRNRGWKGAPHFCPRCDPATGGF